LFAFYVLELIGYVEWRIAAFTKTITPNKCVTIQYRFERKKCYFYYKLPQPI